MARRSNVTVAVAPRDAALSAKPAASSGGHRIGYARVSTDEQNLALQRDALLHAGCLQVYEEYVSRAGPRREKKGATELGNALRALRSGDTFVVWRLDRLGGSVSELIRIVEDLRQRNIGFASLTEQIDTSTASGELVFHIFAALAQFERNLIRERTHAGLQAARARGRVGGRPPALSTAEQRAVQALMRDPGIRPVDVMQRFKISRTTLYKYAGLARGEPEK